MTTHTTTAGDEAVQLQELPPLTPLDRLALATATWLLLRTAQRRRRRAVDRDRACSDRAAADARRTFEHRTWAGPTW